MAVAASGDAMEGRHGVTLLWRIENFTYCAHKKEQRLESPQFRVDVLDCTAWYIRIYPRGCDGKSEVNAYLCSTTTSRVVMDYEIAFLSGDGSPLQVGRYKNKEIVHPWGYGIPAYPTQKEVFSSRKSEFLPQDTLTVRCRLWKPNQSVLRRELYFARTRINVRRRSFLWTVPGFSRIQLGGPGVAMPVSSEHPTFKFRLGLSGATASHARVAIDVQRACDVFSECFATCEMSVLHVDGSALRHLKDVHWFESGERTWKLPHFLSRSDSGKCLSGDELRLFCELTVTLGKDPEETESVCPVPTHKTWSRLSRGVSLSDLEGTEKKTGPRSVLQEDWLSLYKDRTTCDFELRSRDASFPVHKLVLAARSPVFKAMFSSDMEERTGDFLDIPDVDGDTLDRLLLFVYSGTVDDAKWEIASKLYYAADKYEVLSLKQECSALLAGDITLDNVCDILLLADMHRDEELRSSVHDFIVLNDDKVILSGEWKRFLVSHPVLAAETMQMIYSKKLDMIGM